MATPGAGGAAWLIGNDIVLPIQEPKTASRPRCRGLTFHLAQDEIEALDTATRGAR
jgi:hypothetical protein